MSLSRVNGNLTIYKKNWSRWIMGKADLWLNMRVCRGGKSRLELRAFLFLYDFTWCIIINHLIKCHLPPDHSLTHSLSHRLPQENWGRGEEKGKEELVAITTVGDDRTQ